MLEIILFGLNTLENYQEFDLFTNLKFIIYEKKVKDCLNQ